MTTVAPDRTAELERKIDVLTEQVAFLAEEARSARIRRQRWEELQHDVMPIASEAMVVISDQLDDLDVNVTDLAGLLKRLVKAAPVLDRLLEQVEMYSELVGDLMPLTDVAAESAISRLAVMEDKGYFGFAKGAIRVADQVVTGFTEEDVEQLGDNVVLIMQTIKEMTQPEVMAALHRMIEAVQAQQTQLAAEPAEAPSLWQIFKQVRDPEIRRGMARGLNTLRAVSEAETESHTTSNQTKTPAGGN